MSHISVRDKCPPTSRTCPNVPRETMGRGRADDLRKKPLRSAFHGKEIRVPERLISNQVLQVCYCLDISIFSGAVFLRTI